MATFRRANIANARRQGSENVTSQDAAPLDGQKRVDNAKAATLRSLTAKAATTRGGVLASKTTNKVAGAGARTTQGKSSNDLSKPEAPKATARPKITAKASNPPALAVPNDIADDVFNVGVKKEEIPSQRPIKPLKQRATSTSASAATVQNIAATRSALPATAAVGLNHSLIPSRKTLNGSRHREEGDELAQEAIRPKRQRLVAEAPAIVEPPPPKDAGWEDLDVGDEEDPLMVTEYVNEIYDYLRQVELQTLPDPRYMEQQEEIAWRMRGILIDWLIELHIKFRLLPETIFLAVNLVDRFCSKRVVSMVKYQLVGGVALFIAAKYEEIMCPSVSNFLYMSDSGYTEEEFLEAERYLLQMIGWDLSYPNPIHFLRRISKADDYDVHSRTLAKFLMEISCVDRLFIGQTPSMIAAAGAWLARKILDRGEWSPNLIHYSGYTESELLPCAQLMLDYIVKVIHTGNDLEHPNFIKKYTSRKFYKAAEVVSNWVRDTFLNSNEAKRTIQEYARQVSLQSPSMNRAFESSPHPPRVECRLEELANQD